MNINIDEKRRLITIGDKQVKLGKSEILIVKHLIEQKGKVCKKDALMSVGWPGKVVSPNSVQVAIANIRKQLSGESIITSDGGYIINNDMVYEESTPEEPLQKNEGVTNRKVNRKVRHLVFHSLTGGLLLVTSIYLSTQVYLSRNIALYHTEAYDEVLSYDKSLLKELYPSEIISKKLETKEGRKLDKIALISKLNESYVIQCINRSLAKGVIVNIKKDDFPKNFNIELCQGVSG